MNNDAFNAFAFHLRDLEALHAVAAIHSDSEINGREDENPAIVEELGYFEVKSKMQELLREETPDTNIEREMALLEKAAKDGRFKQREEVHSDDPS